MFKVKFEIRQKCLLDIVWLQYEFMPIHQKHDAYEAFEACEE